MNRTSRNILMMVVAVLGVMGCTAVVALGTLVAGGVWLDTIRLQSDQAEMVPPGAGAAADPASPTPAHMDPTVTSTSTQARSMKGWELYSWQMQGEWHFSLVVGTNRLKTFEEVSSPDMRMLGIEALKRKLHTLAGGEQVFWLGQRVPGMARPPDEMVDAIHAYCGECGIELEILWE